MCPSRNSKNSVKKHIQNLEFVSIVLPIQDPEKVRYTQDVVSVSIRRRDFL